VQVNSYLQTSQPDIYALGDCAEINGQVLPFLQPIQLSALYLAKNLLWCQRAAEAARHAGKGENAGTTAASRR
jgi:NAD(P)H-nitrite reductase large subunit